jgi:hypothetical protein
MCLAHHIIIIIIIIVIAMERDFQCKHTSENIIY